MALKPNVLILLLLAGSLLVFPARGVVAETGMDGGGAWRCGEGGAAADRDDAICANGWYCPWCNGYILPAPGAKSSKNGCSPCDPHYSPFTGEKRLSRNQAILIVDGLLRMSDTPDLMAASISEMENIYEARIIDVDGFHVDTLYIHKVNGWVRSISSP